MNSVKPKSQLDKRLDGFSGGGTSYLAGEGLSLNQNVFELNQATQGTLGGIRVSAYATAPEDSSQSEFDSGIYKADPYQAFLGLRRATKKQMGGIYLGDGLAPTVEQNGETYTNTGHVEVRIGEGLEYVENSEKPADERERRQNVLGGRAVAVTKATNEKFGSVKIGKRIGIAADGSIYPVMSGKDGIEVSDNGEISVLIDDETIKLDDNGKLRATGAGGEGVVIENAVVIQEADAKYLLHEYTEVKYVAGNKIGYAGPGNQIIVGGYTLIKGGTPVDPSGSAMYVEIVFPKAGNSPDAMVEPHGIIMIPGTSYPNYTYVGWWDNISSTQLRGENTYDLSRSGINVYWSAIHRPDANHPFGYVDVTVSFMFVNSSGNLVASSSQTKYADFASEAEYNAAIGLTYEPNELVEIQETVTEV